jgi:hypothetical protein
VSRHQCASMLEVHASSLARRSSSSTRRGTVAFASSRRSGGYSPPGLCGTARTVTAGAAFERPGAASRTSPAAREAGHNTECLAPAGTGRYPRPMEISPNWGNSPRLGVQVPPRTPIHAPDLRLFVSLCANVDETAAHSHGGSSPSRTHADVHKPGSSIPDPGLLGS